MSATPEAVAPQARPVITMTLTPTFKLVFLAVLGVTVLSMVFGCSLAVLAPGPDEQPNPNLTAAMHACLTTWKLGFGAIVGLLGGKAM